MRTRDKIRQLKKLSTQQKINLQKLTPAYFHTLLTCVACNGNLRPAGMVLGYSIELIKEHVDFLYRESFGKRVNLLFRESCDC
jgi:hypothetical protein